ncbi:DUF2235 domain-containing protein [Uliginosibacterium paludis]|uniref:DUF2235 domain-containing protein n=1 Tax=Uliginosibacterium paludis TaxID=1615952 RepID=A0ABV2CT23_9RHOO
MCKKDQLLSCQRDAYLGVFFDGTNNNKYRDLPTHSASNVARLFEAFIGSPAEAAPTYGGSPNLPLKSDEVKPADFPFYRKIYVPGVGTACPEVSDPGENENKVLPNPVAGDKTRGLAFAALGEARIQWALLELLNQVHYMFTRAPFAYVKEPNRLAIVQLRGQLYELASFGLIKTMGFPAFLAEANRELAKVLAPWLANKPHTRALRLSVFGFSRGAAEARAFTNMLLRSCGERIGGIPLQIDMLGLFDTVASVGVAHVSSITAGHMAWADGENMVIPACVRRCVHLVSAHEVRMCFPLDSVGQNGHIPENCKEIVYPGVHSDVGGGYGLWDQGRVASDADKISQITLAQMYREARMAGVPLATPEAMPAPTFQLFSISDRVRACFNAYVEKTRIGRVDPASNTGALRTLCPSETQPPEPLEAIMHRHYGHYLAWRKFRLNDVHRLPGLQESIRLGEPAARQDFYDIWQANEQLKLELSPEHLGWLKRQALHAANGDDPGFAETRRIWQTAHLQGGSDQALIDLFDLYVHDSRAWFKLGGESDDEWFGGGKDAKGNVRESKRASYRANLERQQRELQQQLADPTSNPHGRGAQEARLRDIDRELALYEKLGDTLQARGESTQEGIAIGAGYLRWRTVYSVADSRRNAWQLRQYDICVLNIEVRRAELKRTETDLIRLKTERDRLIKTYLDNVQAQRRQLIQTGYTQYLEGLDKSVGIVINSIAPSYSSRSKELEQRINQLRVELAASCETPRNYQQISSP